MHPKFSHVSSYMLDVLHWLPSNRGAHTESLHWSGSPCWASLRPIFKTSTSNAPHRHSLRHTKRAYHSLAQSNQVVSRLLGGRPLALQWAVFGTAHVLLSPLRLCLRLPNNCPLPCRGRERSRVVALK